MITEEILDLVMRLKAAADGRMDQTLGGVSRAWDQAWAEMAEEWEAAIDELVAVAGVDGKWPSRAAVRRSDRAQRALGAAQAALQELSRELPGQVAEDLADLVTMAKQHQLDIIAAQFPEGADLLQRGIRREFDARAMASTIQRTTSQITSLAWTLSPEATAAMNSALIRGMAVGENPRKTAAAMLKRVNGAFNGGRARAENIARTEMMDAFRDSAKKQQDRFSHLLNGWVWTAALNSRTCSACLAMSGKVFPLEEPGPLGHPSCRCARTPETKKWSDLGYGDIPEPDYHAPPTGVEWFEEQSEAQQRKILGPKRYDAWKAGNYPPEQWAVRRENPDWRPSYGVGPVAPNPSNDQGG